MPPAKSKRPRSSRAKPRESVDVRRLLFHECVLEVMLANDLAHLDPQTMTRVMDQIVQLAGKLLPDDLPMRGIADAFRTRVVARVTALRARLSPTAASQN
jgi:hypothetical protein